jgi:isoleucyl-tRNA synthetase
VKEVDACYADYEPTRAAREIQDFVSEHLSNWYVRLSRRRFWKGDYTEDKKAAYQTLYTCLDTIARLMAPISPFFADQLYNDLNNVTHLDANESVHLAQFPVADERLIDKDLEERMQLAQDISSMTLSLRKKVNIKVRQPLQRILLPVVNPQFRKNVLAVEELIKAEVNVEEIEFLDDAGTMLVKKIKPNFKALGPKVGGLMKQLTVRIAEISQEEIACLEQNGLLPLKLGEVLFDLLLEDVEVLSEDIPGWQVASQGRLTVALDVTLTDELREKGLARELVNRIQNIRKDKGFEITDRISVQIKAPDHVQRSVKNNFDYIRTEILATSLELVDHLDSADAIQVEVDEDLQVLTTVNKYSNGH